MSSKGLNVVGTPTIGYAPVVQSDGSVAWSATPSVSPKSFNAKGDGVTDDAAAFNAAIAACPAGGVLYVPAGTYLLKSQITIDKRMSIRGDGKYASILKADAAATGPLLNWNNTSFRPGASLRDISFDLTANTGIAGVYLHNFRNGVIDNVRIDSGTIGFQMDLCQAMNVLNVEVYNASTAGFLLSHASSSGNNLVNCFVDNTTTSCTALFDITGGIDWWLFGCRAFRAPGGAWTVNYGFRADYVAGSGANTNATISLVRCSCDAITDLTSDSASVAGIFFRGVGNSIITDCHASAYAQSDGTHNKAIKLDQCNSIRIQDNWISGHGIFFTGSASDSVKVTNNQFYSGDTTSAQATVTAVPTNLDWRGNTLGQGSSAIPLTDNPVSFFGAMNRPSQVHAGLNLNRPTGALFETVNIDLPGTNNTALTAGTLYLFAIWLPKGLKVTNINWMSGATALINGTGPHYWVALFDQAKALLAQSTDDTAPAIPQNAIKTTALSAPFVTTYEGKHLLGVMIQSGASVAGTQPTMSNYLGLSALAGLSGGPRTATADTGLTTTAPNPAGATSNIGNHLYAYVT